MAIRAVRIDSTYSTFNIRHSTFLVPSTFTLPSPPPPPSPPPSRPPPFRVYSLWTPLVVPSCAASAGFRTHGRSWRRALSCPQRGWLGLTLEVEEIGRLHRFPRQAAAGGDDRGDAATRRLHA